MGFGESVDYVNAMALPSGLLWLSLPVNAVVSIRRQRKRRPGSAPWFAYGVLILWLAGLAACAWAFLSGAWYSENGPAPQVVAAQVTLWLASLAAIHVVLLTSARPSLELPLRQGRLTRHGALAIVVAAGLACAMLYVWTLGRQDRLLREAAAAQFSPKLVQVPPPQIQILPAHPLQAQQFSPSRQPIHPDAQGPMQVQILPSQQPLTAQQFSPSRPPVHSAAQAPPK